MHHYRKTRKEYSRLTRADNASGLCAFCADVGLPQRAVEQTDTMYVIPNRTSYDMFEGLRVDEHLMVIPKRHVETLDDFTDQEKLEAMSIAGNYEKQGYSVYSRGVGSITRSVNHQHTHLIKLRNVRTRIFFFIRKPHILIDR